MYVKECLMRTARYIGVCFNSVFCVVIRDGHFCFVWPPFVLDVPPFSKNLIFFPCALRPGLSGTLI